MSQSRRGFVMSALGTSAAIAAPAAPGILFEGYALPPRKGAPEATLAKISDDRYILAYGEGKRVVAKYSADRGRSWSTTETLRAVEGSDITAVSDGPHISIVRLHSGALGMIYCGPRARPGRDGTLCFRKSADAGKTWSPMAMIDSLFALCRSGCARVLSSGRLAVPAFIWISPYAGGESESASNGMCYSWLYYSDDEGGTWRRSQSELLVGVNHFRDGAFSFEEPAIEELKDGSVLMFGRTELGRQYQSISHDGGVSWSVPAPVGLASSYTPNLLARIPATGDLLLIWNQASAEEIVAGLSRHRLSTVISKDDGATWTSFRNLESLDDRTRIEPAPAVPPSVYRPQGGYRPPVDKARYPHAPGCLRICYPTVAFYRDEVAITYDYGYGGPGELQNGSATKLKIVSLDWLYGRV